MSDGALLVCPTPIGNLDDITLRTLAALRDADVIACEDTRRTRVLLERHSIAAKLVSLHEHNERERAPRLAEQIRAGALVALVSDAGMPVISDPGFTLIQACLEAALRVEVLPGPSASVVALVASGLPAERWCFVGFLPRGQRALESLLSIDWTLVAFESPRRVAASLSALATIDPQRRVAVCRELTKLHEEVVRGTAAELAERYADQAPRGEVVVVLAPADASAGDAGQALEALRELVAAGARPRAAARVLARLTGVGANELYRALTDEPATAVGSERERGAGSERAPGERAHH